MAWSTRSRVKTTVIASYACRQAGKQAGWLTDWQASKQAGERNQRTSERMFRTYTELFRMHMYVRCTYRHRENIHDIDECGMQCRMPCAMPCHANPCYAMPCHATRTSPHFPLLNAEIF